MGRQAAVAVVAARLTLPLRRCHHKAHASVELFGELFGGPDWLRVFLEQAGQGKSLIAGGVEGGGHRRV